MNLRLQQSTTVGPNAQLWSAALTYPEPMQGMSEDEGTMDDEPTVKIDEEKNEAGRKAREERAERLRKMMEDDGKSHRDSRKLRPSHVIDEAMPDAPDGADSQPDGAPVGTADSINTTELAGSATIVDMPPGRRRGRRRVTKKKKVKDEDGYLGELDQSYDGNETNTEIVTKEETVWESFSEDERESKKLKPAPVKVVGAAKAKPTSSKSQGSIASFFKKA